MLSTFRAVGHFTIFIPTISRKGKDNSFNCCLSVHVDNYTIIVPTKCTSLLKAQDITICTFVFVSLAPTCFSPRGPSSGGAMPVPS
jgi:hypothetical protein